MNRTQHHDKAEELLSDARKEPDSFRRHLILAEAQVHATLALSAPAERRPGQDEAGGTESTQVAHSGTSDIGSFPIRTYGPSGGPGRGELRPRVSSETPTGKSSDTGGRGGPLIRETGKRTQTENLPVRPPAELRGDTSPSPSAEDLYPGRRRQRNQRPKQEPGPAQEQEPDPGNRNPARRGSHPCRATPATRNPATSPSSRPQMTYPARPPDAPGISPSALRADARRMRAPC
jgi:hypothetical protein